MNLQQLEYIVAVDRHRHFVKAAEQSFVTQPTLSMMIQKLEDELGFKIFDRSKQPIVPTREGEQIIQRAKLILSEVSRLKEMAAEMQHGLEGEIRIGIIPTLAPYLLPLFLKPFTTKYPGVTVYIKELVTERILEQLKTGETDIGILAGPLHDTQLVEHHLFYEEFFAYASKAEKLPGKKYVMPTQLNPNRLWILEEGHCMRNQVFNLCELKSKDTAENLHYEAGSIETLINLVDRYEGVTVIPRLATLNLKPAQHKNLREFARPKPVREVCLAVNKNFVRLNLLNKLKEEINRNIRFDDEGGKRTVLSVDNEVNG